MSLFAELYSQHEYLSNHNIKNLKIFNNIKSKFCKPMNKKRRQFTFTLP